FVFRRKKQTRSGSGWGPARRDSVLSVVRRAIADLGITDGDRLDVHSFRRAMAADAHRAGVPDDVTRRLTGHETQAMLMHYQRGAVGDDLRAALERVSAYRASARAKPSAPPPEPPPVFGSGDESVRVTNERSPGRAGASEWGYQDSNLRPRPYQG